MAGKQVGVKNTLAELGQRRAVKPGRTSICRVHYPAALINASGRDEESSREVPEPIQIDRLRN
jgi:hypothetical protein